jgi:ribosome modulation factor
VNEPTAEQVAAYDEGRAAADAGQDSATCPHPAGELRLLWVRGFVHARRDAQLVELAGGK